MAISKFKATCLATLERVRRTGRPLRVTRFGKPIADIVPPSPERRHPNGWARSRDDRDPWGHLDAVERTGHVGSSQVNLLLDTHIWLWSHAEPDRLSKRVTGALADDLNQLWLSPISIWEFLLLTERGRVRVRGGTPPAEWVEAALSRAPMHDAPLTREVAVRSRSVRLDHEDPADRFLAATADVYELTLVTADDRLLRGKGFRTLANR